MAIIVPHIFQDSVGEIGSGVQVNENFDVLKLAIEALEAKSAWAPPTARVERTLNTLFLASGTRNVIVTGDIQLEPTGGFGAVATIQVGGVVVAELFAHESIGHPIRVPFSFPVPAGEEWQVISAGHVASLHTSYTVA